MKKECDERMNNLTLDDADSPCHKCLAKFGGKAAVEAGKIIKEEVKEMAEDAADWAGD